MRPLIDHYLATLSRDLPLSAPVDVVVRDTLPDDIAGGYVWTGHRHRIEVSKAHSRPRLAAILAHEYRHAWQQETGALGAYDWRVPYDQNEHERDASRYAVQFVAKHG